MGALYDGVGMVRVSASKVLSPPWNRWLHYDDYLKCCAANAVNDGRRFMQQTAAFEYYVAKFVFLYHHEAMHAQLAALTRSQEEQLIS